MSSSFEDRAFFLLHKPILQLASEYFLVVSEYSSVWERVNEWIGGNNSKKLCEKSREASLVDLIKLQTKRYTVDNMKTTTTMTLVLIVLRFSVTLNVSWYQTETSERKLCWLTQVSKLKLRGYRIKKADSAMCPTIQRHVLIAFC